MDRTADVPASIELDAMLSDLAALVGVESPSHDIVAVTECAQMLAGIIELRLGSAPHLVASDAGPHVHWRGSDHATVLVLGHHDTVFPIGALAERPFTVADGRATGPGVFDMKAGIVQAIHAVAALHDRSMVELLFTADEEVGSRSSRALIEDRARSCGRVLVLEPSADGGSLKTARKGVGTFEVVVRGRAAHAGLEPEKGVNSLVAAAELITQIAGFGNAQHGTTVTPTVVVGGSAENVVPAETRVKIDVRVVEPSEKARLEQMMAGLTTTVPGAIIDVRGGIDRPPMHPSASATLFPVAQRAALAAGMGHLEGVAVGGGSDGNFTADLGVPTLDGLGAVGGGAHADHEYVDVATMTERARLLAALIVLLDG
jgi:glutamate carboxypeptidase